MALANTSGGSFDKRNVKNNTGSILNAGDSENSTDLNISDSTSVNKQRSGAVFAKDGTGSSTSDRAGVQHAISGVKVAKNPSADEWAIFGANVNPKLNSRDYSGSLNDDTTEANRTIISTTSYGSGIDNSFNILARSDANIGTGRTKASNAGFKNDFFSPKTASGVLRSDIAPSRRRPGRFNWNTGGIPTSLSFASRDLTEAQIEEILERILTWFSSSVYPENGIHEDAWIFEIDTTPTGSLYQFPQMYSPPYSPSGFTLPTLQDGYYDCVIDWGDSQTTTFVDTDHTHAEENAPTHFYDTPGVYEIKISGDFRGIGGKSRMKKLFLGAGDFLKVKKIKRWGTKLRFLPDNLDNRNPFQTIDFPRSWFAADHYYNDGNISNWNGSTLPHLNNGQNAPQGVSHIPKYSENIINNYITPDNKYYKNLQDLYPQLIRIFNYVPLPLLSLYDYLEQGEWWLGQSMKGVDENGQDSTIYPDILSLRSAFLDYGFEDMPEVEIRYFDPAYKDYSERSYKIYQGIQRRGIDYFVEDHGNFDMSLNESGIQKYLVKKLHLSEFTELIDPNDNLYDLSGFEAPEELFGFSNNEDGTNATIAPYDAARSLSNTIWGKCKNIDGIDFSNTKILSGFGSYAYGADNLGTPHQNLTNYNNYMVNLPSVLPNLNNVNFTNIDEIAGMFAYMNFPNGYTGISDLNFSGVKKLQGAFYTAKNVPNINNWTFGDIQRSGIDGNFAGSNFNGDVSNWIPQLEDLDNFLVQAFLYNHPSTVNWDTSRIKSMNSLFRNAEAFNQNISSWDTSQVTSLELTFDNAKVFNQPIGNWDTSKVTSTRRCFYNARAFNQDLSNWDMSNVTNAYWMFYNVTGCNYPVAWDLTNLINGEYVLPTGYNQDLTLLTLPVSGHGLFYDHRNVHPSISNIDVSNCTSLSGWLMRTNVSNQDLSGWNTNNVKIFDNLFNQTSYNNSSISGWDTSSATSMRGMFQNAQQFNQPVGSWDISNVTSTSSMFNAARAFDQDISNWNTSNLTDMSNMFANATVFNQDISSWDTSNVTDITNMFGNAKAFNQDISQWDVSKVTGVRDFLGRADSFNQDLSSWNLASLTNYYAMFSYASGFYSLDSWDMSRATSTSRMFLGSNYNHPLNSWDVSNVTNMERMFAFATDFNQDITSWNVSNVTRFDYMFGWTSYNQPLNNLDVSNCTNFNSMFAESSYNQPLDNWDTSNVETMTSMFYYNTAFDQDISSWDFSGLTNSISLSYFGEGLNLSPVNYDPLLVRWAEQAASIPAQLNVLMGTSRYSAGSAAATARNTLINTYSWTITDGGAV